MNCKRCGKEVKTKKKTKAYAQQLCRKMCDGVLRDGGGYPLDPVERQVYTNQVALSRIVKNKGRVIAELSKNSEFNFYKSKEWVRLRYEVLRAYEKKCMVCFAERVELHVDHIKPLSKHPDLALDFDNLQELCRDCNIGKSNTDCIDWRPS
jgi:hypothetical protein